MYTYSTLNVWAPACPLPAFFSFVEQISASLVSPFIIIIANSVNYFNNFRSMQNLEEAQTILPEVERSWCRTLYLKYKCVAK